MTRKRQAECSQHFKDVDKGTFKTSRVACIYCGDTTVAICASMRHRLLSCSKVPTSVGRLPVYSTSSSGATGTPTSAEIVAQQLKDRQVPRFTHAEREFLDQAFANTVPEIGAAFSLFDHSAWREFFAMATPNWAVPRKA